MAFDLVQTFLTCVLVNLSFYLLYLLYRTIENWYRNMCHLYHQLQNVVCTVNSLQYTLQDLEDLKDLKDLKNQSSFLTYCQLFLSYITAVTGIVTSMDISAVKRNVNSLRYAQENVQGDLLMIRNAQEDTQNVLLNARSDLNLNVNKDYAVCPLIRSCPSNQPVWKSLVKTVVTLENLRLVYPFLLPYLKKYVFDGSNGQLYEQVFNQFLGNSSSSKSDFPLPTTSNTTSNTVTNGTQTQTSAATSSTSNAIPMPFQPFPRKVNFCGGVRTEPTENLVNRQTNQVEPGRSCGNSGNTRNHKTCGNPFESQFISSTDPNNDLNEFLRRHDVHFDLNSADNPKNSCKDTSSNTQNQKNDDIPPFAMEILKGLSEQWNNKHPDAKVHLFPESRSSRVNADADDDDIDVDDESVEVEEEKKLC